MVPRPALKFPITADVCKLLYWSRNRFISIISEFQSFMRGVCYHPIGKENKCSELLISGAKLTQAS